MPQVPDRVAAGVDSPGRYRLAAVAGHNDYRPVSIAADQHDTRGIQGRAPHRHIINSCPPADSDVKSANCGKYVL